MESFWFRTYNGYIERLDYAVESYYARRQMTMEYITKRSF